MSSDLIVIRSVSLQDTAQVRFAEHDEVVERFATYRSDEPLNVAVLPRRAWCGRVISDPHCTNAAGVRRTVDEDRGRPAPYSLSRPRPHPIACLSGGCRLQPAPNRQTQPGPRMKHASTTPPRSPRRAKTVEPSD